MKQLSGRYRGSWFGQRRADRPAFLAEMPPTTPNRDPLRKRLSGLAASMVRPSTPYQLCPFAADHIHQLPAYKDNQKDKDKKTEESKDKPRTEIWAWIQSRVVSSGDSNDAEYQENRFLPRSALEQLLEVHQHNIENLLDRNSQALGGNWTTEDTKKLVSYAMDAAPECFAILSYHSETAEKLVEWLHQFFTSGFDDRMLPVRAVRQDGGGPALIVSHKGDDYASIVANAFQLGVWSQMSRESFCYHWQWLFHVPVFRADQFEYEFESGVRLPFISCQESGEETGFSYPVQNRLIHKDHIKQDGITVCIIFFISALGQRRKVKLTCRLHSALLQMQVVTTELP